MKKLVITILIILVLSCNKTTNVDSNKNIPEETIVSNDRIQFSVNDKYTADNLISVQPYVEKFLELCPEINENRSEIEIAKFYLVDLEKDNQFYQQLGWTKAIEIMFEIKKNNNLPNAWDIGGKKLYYIIGSGRVPGIYVNTKQEHLFANILNEKISVVTESYFYGIDEIGERNIIENVERIKGQYLIDNFQKNISKISTRYFGEWKQLTSSNVQLITGNNSSVLLTLDFGQPYFVNLANIKYDQNDFTNKEDLSLILFSLVEILEPYLTEEDVNQFCKTIIQYDVNLSFLMPSGNKYIIIYNENIINISISWNYDQL
ncbi:hypothetical protein LQZ19_04455 [Treponema primitia]|uniref:hypothetical protein n=1 Tax=Treponema primitia TaxID=88058 RepID=UPI003980F6D4